MTDRASATAVQHALGLAAPAHRPDAVADGMVMRAAVADAAQTAACGLHSGAAPADSLVQELQPLPAMATDGNKTTGAAHLTATVAPEEAGRRASVIMMDIEHTPEVRTDNTVEVCACAPPTAATLDRPCLCLKSPTLTLLQRTYNANTKACSALPSRLHTKHLLY